MIRHEVPTHLDVQDKVLCGLTARQTLHLMIGLAAGYTVWTHLLPAAGVPPLLRASAVALCLAVAAVTALVRPQGRGIEEWAAVVGRYAVIPHICVWRLAPVPLGTGHNTPDLKGDGLGGCGADWAAFIPPTTYGRGDDCWQTTNAPVDGEHIL